MLKHFSKPLLYSLGFLLFFLLISPHEAHAARVKKISVKKKIVGIDAGSNEGFTKGKKVCFFKRKKKITCGRVTKVQVKRAIIKVQKGIGKIKKGFQARLSDPKEGEALTAEAASAPAGPYSMAIRLGMFPYPTGATQASYNLIAYNGASSQSGESLWLPGTTYAEDPNSMIISSFGGEFELTSLGLRLGARMKNYTTFPTDSDYDTVNTNIYLRSIISASAIGFFFDYFFMFSGFSIGLGLDFDMTTLTMIATREDDNGVQAVEELYNVSGSANILSLRIPARYDYYLEPVGITLGLNLMVPITALGLETTATANDPLHGAKNPYPDAPETDVITALNFDKGGLVIELILGAFYGF